MLNSNKEQDDLVSIIVPVYNVESRVELCLRSLLAQTYRNIEIIIIDDDSTDNSLSLCEQAAKLDSRIIVRHKEHCGLGAARNAGLEIAGGDLICFCDSDDYVDRQWVEVLRRGMEPETELAICGFIRVHDDTYSYKGPEPAIDYYTPGDLWPLFRRGLVTTVWNKLYRKSLIDKYRLRFNHEKSGEDLPFNLDYIAVMNGRIAVTGAGLYAYYQNPKSITNSYIPQMWRASCIRMDRLKTVTEQLGLDFHKIEDEYYFLYADLLERNLKNAYKKKTGGPDIVREIDSIIKDEKTKKIIKRVPEAKKTKIIRLIEKTGYSTVSGILVYLYYKYRTRDTERKKQGVPQRRDNSRAGGPRSL